MIIIAFGSNKTGQWGSSLATFRKCVDQFETLNISIVRSSSVYATKAVGPGGQDDYLNCAVLVETHRPPAALLSALHAIERNAGRKRSVRWGSRVLDLDLLAYDRVVLGWQKGRGAGRYHNGVQIPICVPHPELDRRPFVVRPLLDIAPFWHHPVSGETITQMWLRLSRTQEGAVLAKVAEPLI